MLDAGEPAILLGGDEGPNPAEYLLHALAACLTTSIVYVAAARKVGAHVGRVDETAGRAMRPSGRGEGLRPDILLSDRDYGLYVVEYTGKRPRGG